jgi:hypothetical protein
MKGGEAIPGGLKTASYIVPCLRRIAPIRRCAGKSGEVKESESTGRPH